MGISIIMLPQRKYPTQHAMLEEVYAKRLPRRGHKVVWVMQSDKPQSSVQHAEWHGTQVNVLPAGDRSLLGRIRTLYWSTWGLWRTVDKLCQKLKPDIIQVRNDVVAGLIAGRMQSKYGARFVYQLSFPEAEHRRLAIQQGILPNRFYYRLSVPLNLYFRAKVMNAATLVLPISEGMRADLIKAGVPSEKMFVFPLGADTEIRWEDLSGSIMRERYGLGDCPVLLYFGTLVRTRRLDFLFSVVAKVAAKCPEVRLLMVGEGETADLFFLKKQAQEMGVADRVLFTGTVPRDEIPLYLAACNVVLSAYPPTPVFLTVSPTKVMESMALCKPVVANIEVYEQREILVASGGGICVPYESRAFAEAVLELLADPRRAAEMGQAGRKYVKQYRSYDVLGANIEAAYQRFCRRVENRQQRNVKNV